jgi:hypothetical protein
MNSRWVSAASPAEQVFASVSVQRKNKHKFSCFLLQERHKREGGGIGKSNNDFFFWNQCLFGSFVGFWLVIKIHERNDNQKHWQLQRVLEEANCSGTFFGWETLSFFFSGKKLMKVGELMLP